MGLQKNQQPSSGGKSSTLLNTLLCSRQKNRKLPVNIHEDLQRSKNRFQSLQKCNWNPIGATDLYSSQESTIVLKIMKESQDLASQLRLLPETLAEWPITVAHL